MRGLRADIGGRELRAEKNKYPISKSQYFSFLALSLEFFTLRQTQRPDKLNLYRQCKTEKIKQTS